MAQPDEVLAGAPLLRRLHERHPDVDIVVLPPERPPGPAPTPVTAATLTAERHVVDATLTALLDASGTAPALSPQDDTSPEVGVRRTWRSATTTGFVVAVAEARLAASDLAAATVVANGLATAMRAAGWSGELRTAGTYARLDAEHDGRTVRVVLLENAVLLTVLGRELPVASATAHRLVGAPEPTR